MAKPDPALPDQIQGAPHPRDTQTLFGQHQAEAAFLDTFNADRLHHAWLLTGPRGVGKATLAWRIARFLLATPQADTDQGTDMFGAPPAGPSSLDIALDHPIARQITAGAAPGLKRITRTSSPTTDKLRSQIVVDDSRVANEQSDNGADSDFDHGRLDLLQHFLQERHKSTVDKRVADV